MKKLRLFAPIVSALALVAVVFACSSASDTPAASSKDTSAAADAAADIAADATAIAQDTSPNSDTAQDSNTAVPDSEAADTAGLPAGVTLLVDATATSDPGFADLVVGKPGALTPDIEVVYPPENSLAPIDFAPITVQWKYTGTADKFIVRFENAEAEIDILGDASAWQSGPGYALTVPKSMWQELFLFPDHPKWKLRVLAATVSGGQLQGKLEASKPIAFNVSTMPAGGAIYYWNTQMMAVRVLEQGQKQPVTVPTPGGMCAGCHSVSPDGSTVAVSHMMGAGMASMSMSLVTAKSGKVPAWLHPKAQQVLAGSFTISAAFSEEHFNDKERWLVVPTSGSGGFIPGPTKLMAVDLMGGKATALVQGGDLGQQAFPSWSKDGSTVVYASSSNVGNGFAATVATSLYTVPFNGGQGGKAQAVVGADDPGIFHYYPTFTMDGKYIVYNRADNAAGACASTGGSGGPSSSGDGTYDNCHAELWMIAATGGNPIRLDFANESLEPLTNSWPTLGIVPGQYHWMAFSSRRNYGFLHTGAPPSPQIYIAAIDPLKIAAGEDPSFAALWLPGQDMGAGCHIARWSSTPRD